MRRLGQMIRKNLILIVPTLVCAVFFAVILWLTDAVSFRKVFVAYLIFSVLVVSAVIVWICKRDNERSRIVDDYLNDYDSEKLEAIKDDELSYRLARRLADDKDMIDRKNVQIDDYEEYVESWVHEIKTPIGLLSLVLDNHEDDIPDDLRYKLEYVRSGISESVDKMLQYSRIKSGRKDYLLEDVVIRDIINEVIAEYRPLIDEKEFLVVNSVTEKIFYLDKRAFKYMISQFVSNSIKYAGSAPELKFVTEDNVLKIIDNGIGVKSCDLPHIFERGFTGDTGEFRQKATGMGLYLVSRLAEDMNIKLSADSEGEGKGFAVTLKFPDI